MTEIPQTHNGPNLNGHGPISRSDISGLDWPPAEHDCSGPEMDPAFEAVRGLYFALRMARTNPDHPEVQCAAAWAWSEVYRHMPPLSGVEVTEEPPTIPRQQRDVGRLTQEVQDADHAVRGPIGAILARALVTHHPDSYPIDDATVAAFDRVRTLMQFADARIAGLLDTRQRQEPDI